MNMRPIRTAKQLTIRYFSVVAVAIVAVHYSVYELTVDDLEHSFVQSRLDKVHQYLISELNNKNIDTLKNFTLATQGNSDFDVPPSVIFNLKELPKNFPEIETIPYGQAIELSPTENDKASYLMKIEINQDGDKKDALLIIDNRLYELSEEKLLSSHVKQTVITLLLTFISLIVVNHISKSLSQPIENFSDSLLSQNPDDLQPISLPMGNQTKELIDMVTIFNRYQEQIQSLIDRERSFNRYASHELRSPLMVIKGALTLLNESDPTDFSKRQLKRIEKSVNDMSEFSEALLSLTKPIQEEDSTIIVDKSLIENITQNHSHLLENKPVTVTINIKSSYMLNFSKSVFQILLGNLIKNAFTYTEQGEIVIEMTENQIRIIDSGKGYQANRIDGYGLGLLLVRDISHRFGCTFSLESIKRENHTVGTVASVVFNHYLP